MMFDACAFLIHSYLSVAPTLSLLSYHCSPRINYVFYSVKPIVCLETYAPAPPPACPVVSCFAAFCRPSSIHPVMRLSSHTLSVFILFNAKRRTKDKTTMATPVRIRRICTGAASCAHLCKASAIRTSFGAFGCVAQPRGSLA